MSFARTLRESYPAVPESVPRARRAVSEFAARCGLGEKELRPILLAVSEALANAVKYAYPDDDGVVELTAAIAGSELWVLIADDGEGLSVDAAGRGLGLGFALIALASDNFTIAQRSSGGIEVRMGFALPRADTDSYDRGSVASAIAPASSRFSTTT